MRLPERIDRYITPTTVFAVGYVLFLVFCYPGFMSFDSGLQLEQARGLTPITNWHPPVMAILWRICDTIIAGPFLMLVLQSGCLLAGMYLILRRVMSDRAAAIAAVLILLSPPVLPAMGVIWKDSQMAGFLMLSIAMFKRRTRVSLVAGCVLVWLATAQRHNALAATLPILLLLFVWNESWPRWKRYGSALVLWGAMTLSVSAANKLIADETEDVAASLLMTDIVGVIKFTPSYTNEQIHADTVGVPWKVDELRNHIRQRYRPYLTWLDLTIDVLWYPKTPETSAAVSSAWRRLVLKHPISYLQHRVRVFLCELRATHREQFYLWPHFSDSPKRTETLSIHSKHSWLQTAWMEFLNIFFNTPVYWAWVYFLAGIALVWLCRRDRLGLAVVSSGVLCEAFLFLVAPAIDFRYSHWMITCTIVAAVYYIAARRRARRDMEKAA